MHPIYCRGPVPGNEWQGAHHLLPYPVRESKTVINRLAHTYRCSTILQNIHDYCARTAGFTIWFLTKDVNLEIDE